MNRRTALAAACVLTIAPLTGCGGRPAPPKPVVGEDLEYVQSMNGGRAAFDRGQSAQAAALYERALRRAEGRDEPADVADAAYNLAVCYSADGGHARAAELLATAERELERSGKPAVDVRVQRATTLRKAGRPDEAAALARLAAEDKSAGPAERSLAFGVLADVALDRGDSAAGAAALNAARASTAGLPPTSGAVSAVAGLEARLSELTDPPAKAAGLHDRHADLLKRGGFYPAMADALADAGRCYAKAGDDRQAADRLYRAARAAAAQGRDALAREWATPALRAAERSADAPLAAQARALVDRVGPPSATAPATRP